jgi:hypothetical protein
MTIPNYINEDRSEIRSSPAGTQWMTPARSNRGRFPATRNASVEALSQHINRARLSCIHDSVETVDTRSASRAAPGGGPTRHRPLKDQVS